MAIAVCMRSGAACAPTTGEHAVSVETLDAPLVAPGRPSLHRLREPPARPARRSPFQPPQQPLGHRLPPVVRGRRAVSLQPAADPVSVVEPTRAATGPSSPFPTSQALFEAARGRHPGRRHVERSGPERGRTRCISSEARAPTCGTSTATGTSTTPSATGRSSSATPRSSSATRSRAQLERGLTFGSQHRLEPQLAELLVQIGPGRRAGDLRDHRQRGRRRRDPPRAGRDRSRPRPQVRGPLPRLARRRVRQHRVRPRPVGPGGPSRDGPVRPPGSRRRALADVVVAQWNDIASVEADPRRAPVGRRRHPVRADRGQRRPDRGPGRVPRGAPPGRDPVRGAPRVRRGHHRVPGRARGRTGADGRTSRPRGVRQGDRRRDRAERGDRVPLGDGADRRRPPRPQRDVQRQPDRDGRRVSRRSATSSSSRATTLPGARPARRRGWRPRSGPRPRG